MGGPYLQEGLRLGYLWKMEQGVQWGSKHVELGPSFLESP